MSERVKNAIARTRDRLLELDLDEFNAQLQEHIASPFAIALRKSGTVMIAMKKNNAWEK